MRIAIIGGGISGLVAGYRLQEDHDVTLYEANDYIGGHTNTVDVDLGGRSIPVDTGFIVFNDRTYPNFIALMSELSVASQPTRMSFSVSCEATGLEYRGADFDGLFAQRRNLFNPRFHRLLFDFMKFNRLGQQLLESDDEHESVAGFLQRNKFSESFIHQYFLPMGSAIWSAPFESFQEFPIRFIAEFYRNHGLLGVTNRPQWRVVQGGSKSYVAPLTDRWREKIHINSPVTSIARENGTVWLTVKNRQAEEFDHVVFACHSDQALRILGNAASPLEQEILSAFPYESNTATLHTQATLLPRNRRAWACWNYFKPAEPTAKATVTYNMNMLQSLQSDAVFCVTLNDNGRIHPENVIKSFRYSHPIFGMNRKRMQQRHGELIDCNQTSFCGAYWGNGFHEDGVKSGMAVANVLARSRQEAGVS